MRLYMEGWSYTAYLFWFLIIFWFVVYLVPPSKFVWPLAFDRE